MMLSFSKTCVYGSDICDVDLYFRTVCRVLLRMALRYSGDVQTNMCTGFAYVAVCSWFV